MTAPQQPVAQQPLARQPFPQPRPKPTPAQRRARIGGLATSIIGLILALPLALIVVFFTLFRRSDWIFDGGAWRVLAEFLIPLIVAAALYLAIGIAAFRQPVPTTLVTVLSLVVVLVLAVGAVVALLDATLAGESPWLVIAPFIATMAPAFIALGTVPTRTPAFVSSVLATLIVAAVAATAAASPNFGTTAMPSTPIATATVEAKDSTWNGRLPDPCAVLSKRALSREGADPGSVESSSHRSSVPGQPDERRCDYWVDGGKATDYANTYTYITYSTESFAEYTRATKKRTKLYTLRPTDVLGQPAAETTLTADRAECTITVGTVFGTVSYRVVAPSGTPTEQACATAMTTATTFYPSVPRS